MCFEPQGLVGFEAQELVGLETQGLVGFQSQELVGISRFSNPEVGTDLLLYNYLHVPLSA